jgi:restriction system protein
MGAFMTGESRPETPLALQAAAQTQLLLQVVISEQRRADGSLIIPGETTDEGVLVEAVGIPWFEIVNELARDPSAAFQIPPERWEEIIAGGYRRAGFEEVTLTPRSGDRGRDVIAIKKGFGVVRDRSSQSVQATSQSDRE